MWGIWQKSGGRLLPLTMTESARSTRGRMVAATILTVAFGYLEAAIVVSLRYIVEPIKVKPHPESPSDELFPMPPRFVVCLQLVQFVHEPLRQAPPKS